MTNNDWYVASVPAPIRTVPPRGQMYQGWTPCIEWCEKQFGVTVDSGWLYDGEGVFKFRDESNCAWFILRWS